MLDHWTAMGVYDRTHRVKLVVDEYGPWYRFSDTKLDPSHVLGQQLTVRDAIMTALTLDTFNRHPDRSGHSSLRAAHQLHRFALPLP